MTKANKGALYPSFRVRAGEDTLLGLEDGCYRQDILQEYLWFGQDVPVAADMKPIWQAAQAVVPKGTEVTHFYDGRTDFPVGRMRIPVVTQPDWRCCSAGTVDVEFAFHGGRVEVPKAKFDKSGEFQWRGCAGHKRRLRWL
jgi:hypothetical protein